MDTETHLIFDRIKLHQLLQQHPNWSERQYAQALGRSIQWVNKWKKRLLDQKAAQGITRYYSRSRAPKKVRCISERMKDYVEDLRDELSEKLHRQAGPITILGELKKHRTALEVLGEQVPRSTRTIAKILHERGRIFVKPKRERIPLVLPPPMEEWEMDFGEIPLNSGDRFEFFIVVDRGTSRLVYIEADAHGYNAERALEAVARLFMHCGLPKRLRFDRDPRFVASWNMDSYPSALVRMLRVLGVEPIVCPPHRPDLKPFVERTIRTLKEEWFSRFRLDFYPEAFHAIQTFDGYYNHERPHQGQACQNQTPDEAYPNLPTLPELPATVNPDQWLFHYHQRVYRRTITSNGTASVDKHTYSLHTRYAHQQALFELDAMQRQFIVTVDGQVVKTYPVQGLHGHWMDFDTYLIVMRHEARRIDDHRRLLWRREGERF